MTRRALSLAALLAAAACDGHDEARQGASTAASPRASPPNVLLITVESLRADHVGALGYGRPTTPNLDALARESTLYGNAFSTTSWTLTSHASIFTGLYPSAHRVLEPRDRLSDAATTLAELLRDHGWATTGLVSGPYLTKPFHLDQGFEEYDDSLAQDFEHVDDTATNPAVEAAIGRFLASPRTPGRPFFLFVYCWDPHYSYLPPPPYDTMFIPPGAIPIDVSHYETNERIQASMRKPELDYVISQYDGEIRVTDEMLGRVFAQLRAKGLWDDTAIVITADHGEEFFEHGQKGHKRNLYRESLHVPLWVKAPAQRSGRRDDRVVNGVDLLPTILDLAGVEYDGPLHGRSLQEPADDERATFHELVTTWYFGSPNDRVKRSDSWFAVRRGDRELITIDFHDGRHDERLYDLKDDPLQRTKLGPQSDASELLQRLAAYRRDLERLGRTLEVADPTPLSPEDEKRLRAAGYIDDREGR